MKRFWRLLSLLGGFLPKLVIWLTVILSITALITKWRCGRPAGTPVHYLLAIILFAGLLPILGPKVEQYVFSKLSKINVGGFKLELFSPQTALSRLKQDFPGDALRTPTGRLSGPSRYQYERLSVWLYQTFDQIDDPNKLDPESREYYRNVIRYVGRAAFLMKHNTKALQITLYLLSLKDRELDADEQFSLGSAYLSAAAELPEGDPVQWTYYNKSLPLLRSAMKQRPRDANIPYNLAWALDSLGRYRKVIHYLRKCLEIEREKPPDNPNRALTPYARQNIASALVKLHRYREAISELESIPTGKWWDLIATDTEILNAGDAEFLDQFKRLCTKRKPQTGP